MIRLSFACDGAAGRERNRECSEERVLKLDCFGGLILPKAVEALQMEGWTFRRFGPRFIVRCPKCEALRVKRNEARQKRDTMRRARKR